MKANAARVKVNPTHLKDAEELIGSCKRKIDEKDHPHATKAECDAASDCEWIAGTNCTWKDKGKVFCTATIREIVGNHSCYKRSIKMANVRVLEVTHIKDLVCPGCHGAGNIEEKTGHREVFSYVPCVKCGGNKKTHTWGSGSDRAQYQILLDKTGVWNKLTVTIKLTKRDCYGGVTRWERVLNSIRNVDPTIVKFRPQSSPGNRGRRY